jgi:hypothetical protein
MNILTKPLDLTQKFLELLDKYPHYYFATAWAGLPSKVSDKLFDNSDRIRKLTVGIHFYQTDPEFFKKFMGINTIRAILQPAGTFHPKLYLFWESDKNWTLLIGSANFTNAAFSVNTEATMLIESSDATLSTLIQAKKIINDSWNRGKIVDEDFYQAYKLLWTKMRSRRKELEGEHTIQNVLYGGTTDFMRLSWANYVDKFKKIRDRVEDRFEMLETVRAIFATGRSLMEMSEDERRLIGGNPNNLNLPGAERYGEFGTSGNGQFMNMMINGNTFISRALDKIPLAGNVTEDNFNEFLNAFLQAPDATVGWVSSAGRLLALKRPDVFYNITNANREGFCTNFKNTQSHTKSLNSYWRLIIEKVQLSTWYNESNPKDDFERRLRETRVAMLDLLFYSN